MANEPPTESSGRPAAGAPADIPAAAGSDGHKDDQIRERAYLIWVDEGRPNGREVDHWLARQVGARAGAQSIRRLLSAAEIGFNAHADLPGPGSAR
jgi:hypothetical protein